MANYYQICTEYFNAQGLKFRDRGDGRSCTVPFSGDNIKSIPIQVIFDKDGEHLVTLDCWDVMKVPAGKEAQAYETCNTLNAKYRWVKFYIDDDNDIRCQVDAIVTEENVGAECRELVLRMVNIIDGAYLDIVRGIML